MVADGIMLMPMMLTAQRKAAIPESQHCEDHAPWLSLWRTPLA